MGETKQAKGLYCERGMDVRSVGSAAMRCRWEILIYRGGSGGEVWERWRRRHAADAASVFLLNVSRRGLKRTEGFRLGSRMKKKKNGSVDAP